MEHLYKQLQKSDDVYVLSRGLCIILISTMHFVIWILLQSPHADYDPTNFLIVSYFVGLFGSLLLYGHLKKLHLKIHKKKYPNEDIRSTYSTYVDFKTTNLNRIIRFNFIPWVNVAILFHALTIYLYFKYQDIKSEVNILARGQIKLIDKLFGIK